MQFLDLLWNSPVIGRYYIFDVLMIIPMLRIMQRAGFSPFWAVLLVIPDIEWVSCAVVDLQSAVCKLAVPCPGIGFLLCVVFLALRKWPQAKEV